MRSAKRKCRNGVYTVEIKMLFPSTTKCRVTTDCHVKKIDDGIGCKHSQHLYDVCRMPPFPPRHIRIEKCRQTAGIQNDFNPYRCILEQRKTCLTQWQPSYFINRRYAFTKSSYLYFEIRSLSPFVSVTSVLLYSST